MYNLNNMGKYLLGMITFAFFVLDHRFPDGKKFDKPYVICAFLYYYISWGWDTWLDWGMFHWKTHGLHGDPNPAFPLREKMMFPPWAYWLAFGLNFLLRNTWLVYHYPASFGLGNVNHEYLVFAYGMLEIFRKSMWALMRFEHEYLVNVENYRVVTAVPLLLTVAGTTPEGSGAGGQGEVKSVCSCIFCVDCLFVCLFVVLLIFLPGGNYCQGIPPRQVNGAPQHRRRHGGSPSCTSPTVSRFGSCGYGD